MAKFVKDKMGKGPSNVEIRLGKDYAICFFRGFMTKAEELIVKSGFPSKVSEHRSLYKLKCQDEIEEIFFRILRKKVKAFFHDYLPEQNMACWTVFFDEA